jgi:hypothetical protein
VAVSFKKLQMYKESTKEGHQAHLAWTANNSYKYIKVDARTGTNPTIMSYNDSDVKLKTHQIA